MLLGLIAAALDGKPLAAAFRDRLFTPSDSPDPFFRNRRPMQFRLPIRRDPATTIARTLIGKIHT